MAENKKGTKKTSTAKKSTAKKSTAKKSTAKKSTGMKSTAKKSGAKPKLLSGGNPQIAKGDGNAPVQAFIAAMPEWKRDVGRRLDRIVVSAVPKVQKAVRWNSPFYGVEGNGWFLSFHVFARYVKVTFLNGSSLDPKPPEASKHPNVRYLHIHEDDEIDEKQMKSWIRQAAKLPGDPLF